jgi:putative transposase
MGRPQRNSQGGYAYHVVCRGLKTKPIFRSDEDYQDFEIVLQEAIARFEPRLLSFCVMPKHWHLVVTPRKDGDLSRIMAWLTMTHSARWHAKPRRSGTGGLYERRFKSFPIQDESLIEVMQFVESHPQRAGLVESSKDWRWSSARHRGESEAGKTSFLSSPPVPLPVDWEHRINLPTSAALVEQICLCIGRGRPYGAPEWVERTAKRIGLESTLRPRGRPRKQAANHET